MKKTLYLTLILIAAIAVLPFVSAQTYLYHATVLGDDDGNLTGTITVNSIVYLKLELNITEFDSEGAGAGLKATGFIEGFNYSDVLVLVSSTSITLSISVEIFDPYSYNIWSYLYEEPILGNETIEAKFNSITNVVNLKVNSIEVHSEEITEEWIIPLTDYVVTKSEAATGSFEAWISLTDPTPTPTPAATAHTFSNTAGIPSWIPLIIMLSIAVILLIFIFKSVEDSDVGVTAVLGLIITITFIAYSAGMLLGAFT